MNDMSELEHDLRATTDDIAADSARITEIEREKAALPVDDPKLTELSAETERLAGRIVPKAAAESDLVDRLGGHEVSDN
jgi:hypothetical protein